MVRHLWSVSYTPDVFDYTDFRRFLGDAYASWKRADRKHSYRFFAKRAGVRSPVHLKLVIEGKRNLGSDTARGFARAFGLGSAESRFFVNLVQFNQARSDADREHYYRELSRVPRFRAVRKVERIQYQYWSRWYCVAVRELVARGDFVEDPAWIAAQVRPSITDKEAAEALEILLELGLVERDPGGALRQSDALLTTAHEIHSLAVRRFHREMLKLGAESLERTERSEREVGGVTLRLTRDQVTELKARLFEIGAEVLQHDGAGEGPEAVYQFSFQLFPLTEFGDPQPRSKEP